MFVWYEPKFIVRDLYDCPIYLDGSDISSKMKILSQCSDDTPTT